MRTNPVFQKALAVVIGVVCGLVILSFTSCGRGVPTADISKVNILYDGEQYGDLEVIWYEVADCIGVNTDDFRLVHIIILDDLFPCSGYSLVNGCLIDNHFVYMAEPVLLDSEGALYAHELVHYFTGLTDDAHGTEVFRTCGTIRLEGFSLEEEKW